MTVTDANGTGDFLHRRSNPGWTAFRGGLLGYAVATAAGAALTVNLSIVTGSFDELRSLQLFMALGTVGVHLGCLMANRPRDDIPTHGSRPAGLAWWANLVL